MSNRPPSQDRIRSAMQVAVSLIALAAGIYVFVTKDATESPHLVAAAAGWVGVVIGYWLR